MVENVKRLKIHWPLPVICTNPGPIICAFVNYMCPLSDMFRKEIETRVI